MHQFAGLEAQGCLGRTAFEMEHRLRSDCRAMVESGAQGEQHVGTGDHRGRMGGRVHPLCSEMYLSTAHTRSSVSLELSQSLSPFQCTHSFQLTSASVCVGLVWLPCGATDSALDHCYVPSQQGLFCSCQVLILPFSMSQTTTSASQLLH